MWHRESVGSQAAAAREHINSRVSQNSVLLADLTSLENVLSRSPVSTAEDSSQGIRNQLQAEGRTNSSPNSRQLKSSLSCEGPTVGLETHLPCSSLRSVCFTITSWELMRARWGLHSILLSSLLLKDGVVLLSLYHWELPLIVCLI